MNRSLESRLAALERERGGGIRILLVGDPPTADQVARIAAAEAEGDEVTQLRDPFQRTIIVRTDVLPKGWA